MEVFVARQPIFDNNLIVIEVLEDVKLNTQIYKACRNLKEKGYTIALDDFVFGPKYLPLLELADIIKVDFLATSVRERELLVNIAQQKDVELLAEKVETREEFNTAIELGYKYFQGYFFSKPVIMTGKDLPISPTNYFRILEELNTSEPDLDQISIILEQDLSLAYKLLKLINSASFPIRERINTIKDAVLMLGINEFEKWINLIILKKLSSNKPKEIIRLSIIRAKFCELVAKKLDFQQEKSKFFLMGMFSLLDVLMNRKLEELLMDLPISKKIKLGLLKREGIFGEVYQLVIDYEQAKWRNLTAKSKKLNLANEEIADIYIKAVDWSNIILSENTYKTIKK